MTIDKKNIHVGHRERLRRRYLTDTLDSFEDHNVLELLLFNSIPQGDTNPAAHKLIERFGTLHGVMQASLEELSEVDGIGLKSATLIRETNDTVRTAVLGEISSRPMNTVCRIGTYLQWWYRGMNRSTVTILIFDLKQMLKKSFVLSENKKRTPVSYFNIIKNECYANGCTDFVIAHNHADGRMIPSADDMHLLSCIKKYSEEAGLRLVDHFIVSGFDYITTE